MLIFVVLLLYYRPALNCKAFLLPLACRLLPCLRNEDFMLFRSATRFGGGLAAAALLALPASWASAEPLTAAAVEKWLAGYERAWESRDAARAAELFTPNASYHEMPFDAP